MLLSALLLTAVLCCAVLCCGYGSHTPHTSHTGGDIGVVNIDAHLDVRPLKDGRVHSGSPFRCLLEDKRFTGRFAEFAAQGNQCSAEHAAYVTHTKKQLLVWLGELQTHQNQTIKDMYV